MQNPYTKDDTQPEFNKALRQLELQLSLEEVDDYIYLEENLPASAPMNANFHNFGDHSVEIQGTSILFIKYRNMDVLFGNSSMKKKEPNFETRF